MVRKSNQRARKRGVHNFQQSASLLLSTEETFSLSAVSNTAQRSWTNFDDFTNMANIYHRFRPLRYRTTILSYKPGTGSVQATVAAFYPVCYYSENFIPGAVTDQTVASMPGSVRYQEGAKNIGPWIKFNPSNNVFSCQEATQGLTQAGFIILAVNSGSTGGVISILTDIEVSFIDRNPFSNVTVPEPNRLANDFVVLGPDKEEVELRGLATALRKIALMHDIESNPGPEDEEPL